METYGRTELGSPLLSLVGLAYGTGDYGPLCGPTCHGLIEVQQRAGLVVHWCWWWSGCAGICTGTSTATVAYRNVEIVAEES
jgi:hypothetical protein